MQLKFNLSTPELVDLYVFNTWSAPWKKKTRQRMAIFIPLGLILFAAVFFLEEQYAIGAAVLLIAVLWFFLYDKFYTNRLMQFAKGYYNHEINERFWAENTYTFKESHIQLSNEYIDSRIQWKAISNIQEREHAFWLFETLEMAHIIPKRTMDEKELNHFKKLLALKLNFK